jgi:hypothetical protein
MTTNSRVPVMRVVRMSSQAPCPQKTLRTIGCPACLAAEPSFIGKWRSCMKPSDSRVPETGDEKAKCGMFAGSLHPWLGLWYSCVLDKGHVGDCQRGGTCKAHGSYVGSECPQWPRCIADALPKSEAAPADDHGLADAEYEADYKPVESSPLPIHRCINCGFGMTSGGWLKCPGCFTPSAASPVTMATGEVGEVAEEKEWLPQVLHRASLESIVIQWVQDKATDQDLRDLRDRIIGGPR